MTNRLTDILTGRLTGRMTNRLTDILTGRLTGRMPNRLTDILTGRLTGRMTNRLTGRLTVAQLTVWNKTVRNALLSHLWISGALNAIPKSAILQRKKKSLSSKNKGTTCSTASGELGWFTATIVEKKVGNVVAQWLVHWTWDLRVESSSPGRCIFIAFLGKTLTVTLTVPLLTQVYKW